MSNPLRVLGVIPARGGSKGIPRKNLAALGGQPLIGWTLRAAAASKLARTVVSTDDDDIARVARELGGDVPFMRAAELATDSARAIPVIVHALDALSQDPPYDAVMMLQPTTPFRETSDIDTAIDLLASSGADAVISVTPVGGTHPARMKYVENGMLIDPPFAEAFENQPRQELRPMVIRNGAVYLTRTAVLRGGSFKGVRCASLEMPESRSVNIDTPDDLAYAEWLLSRRATK